MTRSSTNPAPASPTIHERWLPYADRLDERAIASIDLIVIHCTELPDLAQARAYGEREPYPSRTGNSGHYYIDRDGRIEQWIPDARVAHHVRGWNERSIGIELVNTGRWPDWFDSRRQTPSEPYPPALIDRLIALLLHLRTRFPALAGVAGHDDLDREQVAASDDPGRQVRRKIDPGPLFPWPRVLRDSGLKRIAPGR